MLPVPAAIQKTPGPALAQQQDPDSDIAKGEYLAMTSCPGCHGLDLRSWADPEWITLDLAITAGYSTEDFHRLMIEGIAFGGRELGLMGTVAQSRFSNFTEEEENQPHAYLRTLPGQPVAEGVYCTPSVVHSEFPMTDHPALRTPRPNNSMLAPRQRMRDQKQIPLGFQMKLARAVSKT